MGERGDAGRVLGVPVRVPDVALDQRDRAVAVFLRGVEWCSLARPVLERDAVYDCCRGTTPGTEIVLGRSPATRLSPRGLQWVDITVWFGLIGFLLEHSGATSRATWIRSRIHLGLSLAHDQL